MQFYIYTNRSNLEVYSEYGSFLPASNIKTNNFFESLSSHFNDYLFLTPIKLDINSINKYSSSNIIQPIVVLIDIDIKSDSEIIIVNNESLKIGKVSEFSEGESIGILVPFRIPTDSIVSIISLDMDYNPNLFSGMYINKKKIFKNPNWNGSKLEINFELLDSKIDELDLNILKYKRMNNLLDKFKGGLFSLLEQKKKVLVYSEKNKSDYLAINFDHFTLNVLNLDYKDLMPDVFHLNFLSEMESNNDLLFEFLTKNIIDIFDSIVFSKDYHNNQLLDNDNLIFLYSAIKSVILSPFNWNKDNLLEDLALNFIRYCESYKMENKGNKAHSFIEVFNSPPINFFKLSVGDDTSIYRVFFTLVHNYNKGFNEIKDFLEFYKLNDKDTKLIKFFFYLKDGYKNYETTDKSNESFSSSTEYLISKFYPLESTNFSKSHSFGNYLDSNAKFIIYPFKIIQFSKLYNQFEIKELENFDEKNLRYMLSKIEKKAYIKIKRMYAKELLKSKTKNINYNSIINFYEEQFVGKELDYE